MNLNLEPVHERDYDSLQQKTTFPGGAWLQGIVILVSLSFLLQVLKGSKPSNRADHGKALVQKQTLGEPAAAANQLTMLQMRRWSELEITIIPN